MRSVWWVFKQLFAKDLVYQGFKIMPHGMMCSTLPRNFKANLNYKDVRGLAVVVSFPLADKPDKPGARFVIWITMPWTLPSNIVLCMHPALKYILVLDKKSSRRYILVKTRLPQLFSVMNNKKIWKPEMALLRGRTSWEGGTRHSPTTSPMPLQ